MPAWCPLCTSTYCSPKPMQIDHEYQIQCQRCGAIIRVAVTLLRAPTVDEEKLKTLRGRVEDRSYTYDLSGNRVAIGAGREGVQAQASTAADVTSSEEGEGGQSRG